MCCRSVTATLLVIAALTVGSQSFVTRPTSNAVWRQQRQMILRPEVDKDKEQKLSLRDSPEPTKNGASFDPFSFVERDGTPPASTPTAAEEVAEQNDEIELSLWASRGILLLVALIWGTNFASVKYLENLCFNPPCHHPPSEFALARFGVAGLVSLPLLLKQRGDVVAAGFECGLWIALGYVSQAMALATIPSGECAFICSLTVVFVPVVSALLYGKPIRRSDILAGLIAISGVGILEGMLDFNSLLGISPAVAEVGKDLANTASTMASASASSSVELAATGPMASLANALGVGEGDILALGQPIGFGFAFTRIEANQEKYKDVPNRVLTIAAAQCVAMGLLSYFWVLYDYNGVIPDFGYMVEPHRVGTILWTGIVTTVVAIYLEGVALQKASATDASIAFASEPVWASLFGYLILNETLGVNAYVGGTVIMTGCLLGALNGEEEEE